MSRTRRPHSPKGLRLAGAARAGRLSDETVAEMVKSLEGLNAAAQGALYAYRLALEYADVDAQIAKLHLFDRAARRFVLATRVFDRAYASQPDDFARIIAARADERPSK